MHYKGSKNIKPIKEDIDFNDNVRVSVEHFVQEKIRDTPLVLYIVPTIEALFGFFINFKKKYHVIIFPFRGCNGTKLKIK